MTKKKKPMARSRNKSQPTPGWVWLLIGLTIGLMVAAAVYVRDDLPKLDLSNKNTANTGSTDAREVRKSTPKSIPAPKKTPYSFYDLLPEMEVAIPEEELGEIQKRKPRPSTSPEKFIMQVGSFTQFKDADRMKASLALLGLEANIQTVTIDGKSTRHRVRLGPYDDFERLSTARKQLRKNNIDLILLKIKN